MYNEGHDAYIVMKIKYSCKKAHLTAIFKNASV